MSFDASTKDNGQYWCVFGDLVTSHNTLESAKREFQEYLDNYFEGDLGEPAMIARAVTTVRVVGLAPAAPSEEYDFWRRFKIYDVDARAETNPDVLYDWALIGDWIEWAYEELDNGEGDSDDVYYVKTVLPLVARYESGERSIELGKAFMAAGEHYRCARS